MPQCQFPVFCCFWFQKVTSGNILGIARNKRPGPYFSSTYTESEGETKKSHEVAKPPQARQWAQPRHLVVWAPRGSADIAPSPIYSPRRENPKTPSLSSRTYSLPPPSSTLTRGVSEALPGTLPERGIITGGLYIAMPASGVMCE